MIGPIKLMLFPLILLLFDANDVDLGRHNATSQTPKNIAGIDKTTWEMNSAIFRGEQKYTSIELPVGGVISKTEEKLINVAPTTTIIIIPCTR
jgi:hypothetical protein